MREYFPHNLSIEEGILEYYHFTTISNHFLTTTSIHILNKTEDHFEVLNRSFLYDSEPSTEEKDKALEFGLRSVLSCGLLLCILGGPKSILHSQWLIQLNLLNQMLSYYIQTNTIYYYGNIDYQVFKRGIQNKGLGQKSKALSFYVSKSN